jgi:hypothetical protein
MRRGVAGQGIYRTTTAWLGAVRLGLVVHGLAGIYRTTMARLGQAGQGRVRHGPAGHGFIKQLRSGVVIQGQAGRCAAWQGAARFGWAWIFISQKRIDDV